MRALVTGGTGFVGANLVRRLLADGHSVHLLVRPSARLWRIRGLEQQVAFHTVALESLDDVRATVQRVSPDWIFHLAVHGAYSFEKDVSAMVLTNVLGTANLLQAAVGSGFAAFVNTGSSSEYGVKDHAPSEDEALEPNSYYAVTKASGTWLCRLTAREQKAHIPTLRLYSVYGPYEDERRLMPTLVRHALNGGWPPLASPDTARDYVYVDDVVSAYILAATVPRQELGAVYNVGTGVQTTLAQLAEIAGRVFGVRQAPQWGNFGARAWDTSTWVAAPQKIHHELGWRPAYDLERGLEATAAWVRAEKRAPNGEAGS